ncbi:hypothetical protein L1887_50265 [Cichorium endivia]|nr:hypothetical protein L1887_50265 [Cichorium endivia]
MKAVATPVAESESCLFNHRTLAGGRGNKRGEGQGPSRSANGAGTHARTGTDRSHTVPKNAHSTPAGVHKTRGNPFCAPRYALAARQLALDNVAGDDGDRITNGERAQQHVMPVCHHLQLSKPLKAAGSPHITADGKPTFLPKHARERAKIARHRVSASRQMQNSPSHGLQVLLYMQS